MTKIQKHLVDKANKPISESKKWLGAIFAVICVMVVYFCGVFMIGFGRPDISTHIVSLSNVCITFLGMVFSTLILGQSAVDWKSMHSLSSTESSLNEAKSYDEHIEKNIMIQYKASITDENDPESPKIKPYTVLVD